MRHDCSRRRERPAGAPSVQDRPQLLAQRENAGEDRVVFALAQLASWLLAAREGRATNVSIQHRRAGHFSLTPFDDVLSAWPIIGDGPRQIAYRRVKQTMAVPGERSAHSRLRDSWPRHWQRLGASCGPGAWGRMRAMVEPVDRVLDAAATGLPPGFPGRTRERKPSASPPRAATSPPSYLSTRGYGFFRNHLARMTCWSGSRPGECDRVRPPRLLPIRRRPRDDPRALPRLDHQGANAAQMDLRRLAEQDLLRFGRGDSRRRAQHARC